ncbi:MAG: hypothetical protein IKO56_10805, partial [Alphaproteobacteria bacterium]|nr:hypothetical protein [Alphaproteobacteria bacterium]
MGNTLNEDIKCPHCGETINADVEQKKYKQLYDRYNQCRDAELDRFWKNSTFVWVMMALCYTAFGLLLSKYCGFDCEKTESNSVHKCVDECMKDRYEIALVVISIFGFVLSKIRIWMARGLKAWYEVYEDAIWDMEEKNNVFHYDRKYTIENYWYVKNEGLWLFKSNNYSPSKIVILIGRVMGFIWFVTLCVMLFKYYGCDFIKKDMLVFKWVTEYPNLVFWGMVTLIWIIIHLGLCLIKSSSLRDSEEEIVYHNIRHDNGIKCYKEYYNYDLTYFEVKNKIVS